MHNVSFSRYTRTLIGTALLTLMAWIAIVSMVDPYGLLGTPPTRYTAVKPRQNLFGRIYKPIDMLRGNYNGIILGASRELRGLNPNNPALTNAGYRVYNLAMVEQRPYEMAELAKFAFNTQNIKLVMIGLDFTRYDALPSMLGDKRLYYPEANANILWWALARGAGMMMSVAGIDDSYATVMASLSGEQAPSFLPGGQLYEDGDNPGRNFNYLGVFRGRLSFFREDFLPMIVTLAHGWVERGFDHSELLKIIRLAAAHGARIVIFTDPDHALEMELEERMGLWPALERWKRELACITAEARITYPSTNLSLWDFNGYSPTATEPLVHRGDGTLDYWDPVHFDDRLGDRMIATMFSSPVDQENAAALGVPIDPSNIDDHLRALRIAAAKYRLERADDIAWLDSIAGDPGNPDVIAREQAGSITPLSCKNLIGPQ